MTSEFGQNWSHFLTDFEFLKIVDMMRKVRIVKFGKNFISLFEKKIDNFCNNKFFRGIY